MGITAKPSQLIIPFVFSLSLLFGQLIRIPFLGGTIFIHDIVLFILAFISSCIYIVHKQKPEKRTLIGPFSYFIVAVLISLLFHVKDIGVASGFLYLARYVFYFFAYLMVFRLSTPYAWLLSLFVAGTLSSFMGLIQYVLYPDLRNLMYLGWDPHYQRLFGIFFDPNFAGIFIVLTILLGLYFLNGKKKWLVMSCELVNVLALVLTFSRSSYLSMIGGIVVLLFFLSHKKIIASLLIGLLLIFMIVPTPLGGMFSSMRQTSALARITNWQESIDLVKISPIIGHGFYLLQNKKEVVEHEQMTGIPTRAGAILDNSFLFVFATTGILGFGTFVYLWISMFMLGNSMKRKEKTLGAVYIASLVAVIIDSFFVNALFYPWVILWVWVLTASGETLRQAQGKRIKN